MDIDYTQLEFIDLDLRGIMVDVERLTGQTFTITSLYRIGDEGVHGQLPLRGTDLRCRDMTVGLAVQRIINDLWQYDPDRPAIQCCLLHGEGANLHLHLQTHPNTIQRS